jgi:AcrR family transcriptional regulator
MSKPHPADQRRAEVLDAAAQLFIQLGYEATSMEAVASAAGVSRATVFNRFGEKRELLRGLYDRQLEGLLERLKKRPTHLGFEGQIAWFFRQAEAALEADGPLTPLLIRAVLNDPLLLAHDEARGLELRAVLVDCVRAGQAQGQLRAKPAAGEVADLLLDLWRAALGRWAGAGAGPRLAREVRRRLRWLLRGLAAPGAPGS